MSTKIQEKNGFTLVEVITVVAILLILAAFAVPEAQKAKPNFELRSLAHDVLATMQRARSLAVQQNTSVRVDFDGDGYKMIEDINGDGDFSDGEADPTVYVKFADYGKARRVANGKCGGDTQVSNALANGYITFTSRGTAQGSKSIYLDNGEDGDKNQHCYEITPLSTGSVKLEKK